jgi:S1-C subfamily serine protease
VRADSGPLTGQVAATGLGSGVLISADGRMLTAAHVIQTADAVRVNFDGGENIPAKVLRSDPAADVALLQLEWVPTKVKPAKLGNSDEVRIGEEVFVIGAPHGLTRTLTVGYISARHDDARNPVGLSVAELFQTDAAINQGNSGGPMFNMRGEVVGVVSHIVSLSGGSDGLGFAVTANSAMENLSGAGAMWSGIDWIGLSGEFAEAFNLPQAAGILVQHVAEGSIGARLGLRGGSIEIMIDETPVLLGGDVILEVQGVLVSTDPGLRQRYRDALAGMKPGDRLTVEILRAGKRETLATTLEAED